MVRIVVALLLMVSTCNVFSQVGIGTTEPNSNSLLDLESADKGFLPPRMTTAERESLSTVLRSSADPLEAGMIVYDNQENRLYVWDGTQWMSLIPVDPSEVSVGNAYSTGTSSTNTISNATPLVCTSRLSNSFDFTITASSSRLTYTGADTKNFVLSAAVSVRANVPVSGTDSFKIYLAKNGALIPGAITSVTMNLDNVSHVFTLLGTVELSTNDTVEIYVVEHSQALATDHLSLTIKSY